LILKSYEHFIIKKAFEIQKNHLKNDIIKKYIAKFDIKKKELYE
jgi:hypothetical protein